MADFHGMSRRSPTGPLAGEPTKFGRMFPDLGPQHASEEALRSLAAALVDESPEESRNDNDTIPAGFTYLGQFLDHDFTLDITPLDRSGPGETMNFRTPRLDLDSVYGLGPDLQPFMYQRAEDDPLGLSAKLAIGKTSSNPGGGDPGVPTELPNDLPRSSDGFAIIGDKRNDENLIVGQLHLAMLKFHNKVVDHLVAAGQTENLFAEARRTTTWHYQWMVVHDFLARIVDDSVLEDVQKNGRKYYTPVRPFIPVEFSVAAYRLGHSMVREVYDFNRVFRPSGVAPASLGLLFRFTGLSGNGGDAPIPSDWIIDWNRFFETGDNSNLNFSRELDPFAAPQLHNLPLPYGEEASLPFRNLLRGNRVGLPSGQRIAAKLGCEILSPREIASGRDGEVAERHGLHETTPLWYYILKEAQIQGNGKHLGEVGSRIVAEVFLGMLEQDPGSYLAQAPEWTPTLPRAVDDEFTMVDILKFVDELNPIGDAPQ